MAVSELRLHLLSLVLLCVLSVFGGPSVRGPHRCYYFNNVTYLLTKKNLNWDETEKYCKTFRGRLPTPRNKLQVDFLSNQIDWKGFKVKLYWIGLTSDGVTSKWNWKDGSPLTFANWNINWPTYDKLGLADCAYVNVRNHHTWEDMTCYEKKNIAAVCHLEGHAWSSWSRWGDCNCSNYIQQRTRVCGTSDEARDICPCPGTRTENKSCSCLSRWKEFRKDNSRKNNFILVKRVSAENLVVCSMICLQERFCYRFSFPGRNTCNLYKRATSPVPAATADTIDAYIAVDEGQWISSF